ncbi:metal ABC transporter ATP-binding protein [Caldanaerobius polysaccharolyticus]|uniref:metal ABC transporter ATP-binding protein n=1 Tax=Caldanaerobius polysaccharolyticus TaxID=44256 RepID=UPI00047ADD20|nr:metal ABC transporter ATP-binding protein [Caldanaerobius polysaccharolyticus]
MENAVEVKNVSFSYGRNQVLNNVSFTVKNGEFIAVIGPNGSGKSTLMNLIIGKLKPSTGQIYILGKNAQSFSQKHLIGYVPQRSFSFNISFPASVSEVVEMGLYASIGLFKKLNPQHRKRVEDALKLVDMYDYKDALIGNLSGGQMQRVFIARCIVSDPQILILDEPTVGIDARSERNLFELLERLNKSGITIIMVTHDIMAITDKVNRIVCLSGGKVNDHCTAIDLLQTGISDLYGYPVKVEKHQHGGKRP